MDAVLIWFGEILNKNVNSTYCKTDPQAKVK